MKRLLCVLLIAAPLGACAKYQPPGIGGMSNEEGRNIAIALGQVIGPTKADEQIRKYGKKFTEYCGILGVASASIDLFGSAKVRDATLQARQLVSSVCANPPEDLQGALIILADAITNLKIAQKEIKA